MKRDYSGYPKSFTSRKHKLHRFSDILLKKKTFKNLIQAICFAAITRVIVLTWFL